MIDFTGSAILLDIEGTTSSIQFVYEVLFPYARKRAEAFLRANWQDPSVQRACHRILREAGQDDGLDVVSEAAVLTEMKRLMDADAKTTGLKELQGLIWEEGYREGKLQSHLYPDVEPALRLWTIGGLQVRIFSSGSVAAQKVFFQHTAVGNLLPLLSGHYDTTIGPKREAESYRRIAADMKKEPSTILFLSDVPHELDAAEAAGVQTGLVIRPGNAPVASECLHPRIDTFSLIRTAM